MFKPAKKCFIGMSLHFKIMLFCAMNVDATDSVNSFLLNGIKHNFKYVK